MANSKENNRSNKANSSKNEARKIKVLYQYLGGQWYAFAEDESEVYFGKVPVNAKADSGSSKNTKSAPHKKAQKENK